MDLSTTHLRLELKNPIVPSSSPLTRHISTLREMEDAGAAGVVLYSLFEEEINRASHTLDRYLTEGTELYAKRFLIFLKRRVTAMLALKPTSTIFAKRSRHWICR